MHDLTKRIDEAYTGGSFAEAAENVIRAWLEEKARELNWIDVTSYVDYHHKPSHDLRSAADIRQNKSGFEEAKCWENNLPVLVLLSWQIRQFTPGACKVPHAATVKARKDDGRLQPGSI